MADVPACACDADTGLEQAVVFGRDVLDGWHGRTHLVVRPNLLAGALGVLLDVLDPTVEAPDLREGPALRATAADVLLQATTDLFSGPEDPNLAVVTAVVLAMSTRRSADA